MSSATTDTLKGLSLEALAESEHRFRELVEALPDAILVHSENKVVFVNPFCVRLLAAAGPDQLLGRDISGIIGPEYLPAIRSRIQDCYATGTASPPTESTVIACDGSSVDIEAVAIPINWNGAPAIEVVMRDIRKRKRAEQEAHDWQKRLELAQKAGLQIGLWDWDPVANTVIWSDESYRQFGYTRETFSGRVEDAVTRIHPEDRSRVEEAIRKVIAGEAEYAQQYRLVWPDGTICWIDAHGVIVRNGSVHMLGIGVDITDLKKTQQSLQEGEEKYLLLLNSTADGIYGLDLKGNCTFCNPACLRLLGYKDPNDLLGRNMHDLMHHTRADGTPYRNKNAKSIQQFAKVKAIIPPTRCCGVPMEPASRLSIRLIRCTKPENSSAQWSLSSIYRSASERNKSCDDLKRNTANCLRIRPTASIDRNRTEHYWT